jgi:hypothetical protein
MASPDHTLSRVRAQDILPMKTIIKHWFTGRDNETFSYTKLASFTGVVALVYNFVSTASGDFQGFGTALGLIIAAHAAKHYTEKPDA